MEKEEQQVEEQQEEEETSLVVRKSRNENGTAVTFEVSQGVSESNGHALHSQLLQNGAQNQDKTPAQDQEREKLNGVLENEEKTPALDQERVKLNGVLQNESEPINGEQKSENLVFHDNLEGVESESTYFGEKQNLEDPGPQGLDISSLDFIVQNNFNPAINNRYEGEIENNSISNSNLKPSQISFQEGITSYESSKEIESAEVDLVNEDDLEVSEEEVERVIQKQTTHDLYCPNCNSCITKRVILRKRKRRIRISDEEVKRNRTETAVHSKLGVGLVESPSNQVDDADPQIPAANEDERERGPDLFRCLSCFSFFIPTGYVIKLKKNWFTFMLPPDKQTTAVVEQGSRDAVIPSSNLRDQSGDPSLSQKTRTPTQDVGDKILPSPSSDLSDQSSQPLFSQKTHTPIQEGWDQILPFPKQKPSTNGVAVGVGDKLDAKATKTVDATMELFDSYTPDQSSELKSSQVLNGNHEWAQSVTTPLPTRTEVTNGKSADDTNSFSQEGLKLLIPENNGSSALDNSDEVHLSKQMVQPGAADKEVTQLTSTSVPVFKASDVDGNLNISVSIPHAEQDVRATILTESVLENKNANFSSSDSGHVHHSEVSQHRITKTEIEVHSSEPPKVNNILEPNNATIVQSKDTVILIDQQTTESSHITHPTGMASVSQSVTQSSVADGERIETRKEFEIEVVKSIVYGGLAESITSLSVVSSAAGGGGATLNVLALGAANLIGGLFIIFHNLWDLKSDGVEQVSNEIVVQRDRYKEVLGRRQNFLVHAIVAIISYIIFGLVPPIMYGLSFRKSDDRQLKLVVVGAASLVCILILAIAKAYTQRHPKPYLKTVTTYVIVGFMVSGVSYAAGELVERLLKELGLFQTSPVSNLVVPQTGSGWASY